MPLTRIPDRYEPGLVVILALSSDPKRFSELLEALKATRPLSQLSAFSDAIYSHLEQWKRSEILNVVRTLHSLSSYLADDEMTPVDLASQILEVMRATGKEKLSVPENVRGPFVEMLSSLLQVDSIRLASKAFGLRHDHEREFCEAKIITDMRPVFADVHQKPTRVIVGHTLKLGYHEYGEHKEFYLALDGSDVAELKKILQRAEDKESSLRNLIADTGLTEFDHS
jgi:hypothetical protein